jgi:hypothetical protein
VRLCRRPTALLLLGVLLLNACYATGPVAGVPAPGMRIVADLNDQGRVAYGDRIGSSVREIEGTVESASDSAFVVRIQSVRYLDGRADKWSGERFALSPEYVSRVRQRELSRSRTTILGVVIGAAVVAAVAAANLLGTSTDGSRGDPDPGGGDQ